MATKIIHKKSSVAEKVPLTTDLEVGELAINLVDKKLFSKDGNGNIIEFGSVEVQQLTVYNGTGATIPKGSVVYINGAQGQKPSIALASNASEATSSKTFGFVVADILNGAEGTVTTEGLVYNLNTGVLTEGGAVYLGATAGSITQTKPVAPAHMVSLGWVVKANASSGRILAHVQNGFELDELHDVLISSPANAQVLSYEAASGLWKNTTVASGGATSIDGLSDAITNGSQLGLGGNALWNLNVSSSSANTAVGYAASYNLTTGSYNTAVGQAALRGGSSFATGGSNTGVGYQVGYELTTGGYNFLGGYQSGLSLTTGSNNVAIGNGALDAATTGGRNIAIGQDAMGLGVATAASGDNVAIGYQAGYDITSATSNVLLGYRAGWDVTTGTGNVAIGQEAGDAITTGSTNVAVGLGCLSAITTASSDIAIGYNAMVSATSTSPANIAIGQDVMRAVSSGGNNTGVGSGSLRSLGVGSNNTAFGYDALKGTFGSASHSNNTGVGHSAGLLLTTGTNNTFVGYQAGDATTTGSNQIVIGNGADASSATVSNEITLGNSSVTRFRVPGAGIDNTSAALSGTTPSVDAGARDTYTLTTSGNTTFTFTGVPSSGQVGTFSLIITAGGTHTLTWPASVDWAGGTAPAAPASGQKDIYTFMTIDGGTIWYGFQAGDAMA